MRNTGQMRAFFVADTGLSCCAISETDGRTVLMAGADNGMLNSYHCRSAHRCITAAICWVTESEML